MIALVALSLAAAPEMGRAYSPEHDRCMAAADTARGVTVAMMDCLGDEIDRQDARLNRVYRARLAALPRARAAALRRSERAWIKRRDARCARSARAEGGGSLAGLVHSGCMLDETVDRIRLVEGFR